MHTSAGLTPIQWLICAIAAIGFAFDTYELLMLPLIVGPALGELGAREARDARSTPTGWGCCSSCRRSSAASSACSAATSPIDWAGAGC